MLKNNLKQMFEGWYPFNNQIYYVEVFLVDEYDLHGSTTKYEFLYESVNKTFSCKQFFYQSICPNMTELNLFNYYEDVQKFLKQ